VQHYCVLRGPGLTCSISATFFGASTEIEDILTNLRQALYEERSNLRRARIHVRRRRQSAGGRGEKLDPQGREGLAQEDAIQAMSTGVKDMIKSFKSYERPFIVEGLKDPRRRKSDKERWGDDTQGYSSGGLGEDEHADYLYAPNRYKHCGFKERLIWIRYKSRVVGLTDAVMRFQVRRIGIQTTRINQQLRELSHHFEDFDDRLDSLDRMEQRLSRIVNVRRVD
jgi:hypothetical protein